MRIGICDMEANFVPGSANQMGIEKNEWEKIEPLERLDRVFKIIKSSSFDYIELGIPWLNGTFFKGDLQEIRNLIFRYELIIGAYCSFVPGHIKTAGPEFDPVKTENYLRVILPVCYGLGGRVIVFGSGVSRSVPEGYDKGEAKKRLSVFLKQAVNIIKEYKFPFKIAIEPLNASESNMVNSLYEAYEVAMFVDSPSVGVLVDTYHAIRQDSSFWEEIPIISEKIFHVHISQPQDRSWPGSRGEKEFDFARLSALLKDIFYKGDISVECNFKNLAEEIQRSYTFLNKIFR